MVVNHTVWICADKDGTSGSECGENVAKGFDAVFAEIPHRESVPLLEALSISAFGAKRILANDCF